MGRLRSTKTKEFKTRDEEWSILTTLNNPKGGTWHWIFADGPSFDHVHVPSEVNRNKSDLSIRTRRTPSCRLLSTNYLKQKVKRLLNTSLPLTVETILVPLYSSLLFYYCVNFSCLWYFFVLCDLFNMVRLFLINWFFSFVNFIENVSKFIGSFL